ncbi:hypothetical protein T4D_4109 [Trichinella pseudospiralis]|uniref:Uncharacterized protein n=1 Tax=Trichinella pseudospiralis TaxID=6337 RepID=A0A0V1F511_TRIPS|nr:hypothetical protein T4D_528 [Trichinella pseudospiralis]KRY81515.1 hypothetical protein T4D_4109 [Trichinella pseudospiralis]
MEQKKTLKSLILGVSLVWREPYTRVKKHLPSKKSALTITSHNAGYHEVELEKKYSLLPIPFHPVFVIVRLKGSTELKG